MINGEALASGRVQYGRFGPVQFRYSLDVESASTIIHTQHYHNRFYLYGLYNSMSTNSIYACNVTPGMYTGGANRHMNIRGSRVIKDVISAQQDLLKRIASFMNMEFGSLFNPTNDPDGVDVLRGISWTELSYGVDMLNDYMIKLHYLSASNKIKITRDNKHMWSYINEYRHRTKTWLTKMQLDIYRKFRKWMKAEQFNATYIREAGIEDEIVGLYEALNNWCKSVDQFMYDMTTHNLNMLLYNNTSAADYGDETYACTKLVNEITKDGAAMVIQNAMRKYMKRKCVGTHRGRCNQGFFINVYVDLNLGRAHEALMVQDPDQTIYAPGTPSISPIVLNAVILTNSFWLSWEDWMQDSVIGCQEQRNGISVNSAAIQLSRSWWPTDGYAISRISIRDEVDDSDDDIEYDVIGDEIPDDPSDDESTEMDEYVQLAEVVYDISAEIDDDNAPAA